MKTTLVIATFVFAANTAYADFELLGYANTIHPNGTPMLVISYGPGGWAGFPDLYNGPQRYLEVRFDATFGFGQTVAPSSPIPWEIGLSGVVAPGQIKMPVISARMPGGGPVVTEMQAVADGRTQEQRDNAPTFASIRISSTSNQGLSLDGLVTGQITNVGANPSVARIEFFDGVSWVGLNHGNSSGVQPDGTFRGIFLSATNPPVIRVILPQQQGVFGYATSQRTESVNYSELRAPLQTPSGPRSRFNTRSKAGANGGIRG